jgi:serine/threonine protein kinase
MTRDATAAGIILGTTSYMSPEQARARTVDRRTDIWAFGCCWFESLTCERAFEGQAVADVISAIVSREPDWSLLPRETPSPLRELLRACIEKDVERRLDDIGRVRELLSAPSKRPLRRFALAALGLGIVATIAWFALRREEGTDRTASSRAAVAVLPFTVRGSSEIAYLGEGMVNLLSTKLDGAGDLRSVDSRALLSLVKRRGLDLADPETSRRLAEELDASHYVTGDIVEASGRIQIEAALYESGRDGELACGPLAKGDTATFDSWIR